MGIFNIIKPKKKMSVQEKLEQSKFNTYGEPLDKLIDGELPFGWVAHNRTFTSEIEEQNKYFLHLWLDNRNKSLDEYYSALKSFILFLEDTEKLCISKGECFEFWFYEILTTKKYLSERKLELQELELKRR